MVKAAVLEAVQQHFLFTLTITAVFTNNLNTMITNIPIFDITGIFIEKK